MSIAHILMLTALRRERLSDCAIDQSSVRSAALVADSPYHAAVLPEGGRSPFLSQERLVGGHYTFLTSGFIIAFMVLVMFLRSINLPTAFERRTTLCK